MAAAALTKFLPALLALQFLSIRRGRSRYALTLAAALAAMLAWPLITSGPAQFLDSTFGYQLLQRGGGVQFSIWTYLPHVAIVARPVLAAALVLLALSPMMRPGAQDARQDAALSAALLIGAQLLLGYWFYSYLTWCYPLLIIAIIRTRPDHEAVAEVVRAEPGCVADEELCCGFRRVETVGAGAEGSGQGRLVRRWCPVHRAPSGCRGRS